MAQFRKTTTPQLSKAASSITRAAENRNYIVSRHRAESGTYYFELKKHGAIIKLRIGDHPHGMSSKSPLFSSAPDIDIVLETPKEKPVIKKIFEKVYEIYRKEKTEEDKDIKAKESLHKLQDVAHEAYSNLSAEYYAPEMGEVFKKYGHWKNAPESEIKKLSEIERKIDKLHEEFLVKLELYLKRLEKGIKENPCPAENPEPEPVLLTKKNQAENWLRDLLQHRLPNPLKKTDPSLKMGKRLYGGRLINEILANFVNEGYTTGVRGGWIWGNAVFAKSNPPPKDERPKPKPKKNPTAASWEVSAKKAVKYLITEPLGKSIKTVTLRKRTMFINLATPMELEYESTLHGGLAKRHKLQIDNGVMYWDLENNALVIESPAFNKISNMKKTKNEKAPRAFTATDEKAAIKIYKNFRGKEPKSLKIRTLENNPVLIRIGTAENVLYKSNKYGKPMQPYTHSLDACKMFYDLGNNAIIITGNNLEITKRGIEG